MKRKLAPTCYVVDALDIFLTDLSKVLFFLDLSTKLLLNANTNRCIMYEQESYQLDWSIHEQVFIILFFDKNGGHSNQLEGCLGKQRAKYKYNNIKEVA